ncbi:hypothetical protein ACTVZD_27585 [Pseudomonas aeruginosa]
MNSQDRAARIERPSYNAEEKAKVVYTDAFEKKKKKQDYDTALDRILARARKTDW